MPLVLAATISSPQIGASNEAVITFASENESGGPNSLAARIHVLHRLLTQGNLISQSSVTGVTYKDPLNTGLGALNASVDNAEYLALYADAISNTEVIAAFVTPPAAGPGLPGDLSGIQALQPVGSSVLVTQRTTSQKGRIFLPFASYYALNANDGLMQNSYYNGYAALMRWFHFITFDQVAAGDNTKSDGVYSRKNNTYSQITSVDVRRKFSSLASRRR